MHDADNEVPFVTDAGVKSGDGSLLSYKKGGRVCWCWWRPQQCAPRTDARSWLFLYSLLMVSEIRKTIIRDLKFSKGIRGCVPNVLLC